MAKKRVIPIVLFGLTASFLVVLTSFFFPAFRQLIQGTAFMVILILIFLLGLLLLFLVLRQKVKQPLRKFLLLTSIGAVGFFGGAFLHNFFYGLGVLFNNIPVLGFLMELLHVAFFLISILVSPVIFLIGLIGSLIIFLRKKV
ncbi:MAG: hypothetical protein ABH867_04705 [Patescibacteria group bacterium]|nr:hypothetical protein [Patescibacteria group bacterium]